MGHRASPYSMVVDWCSCLSSSFLYHCVASSLLLMASGVFIHPVLAGLDIHENTEGYKSQWTQLEIFHDKMYNIRIINL